MRKFFPLIIILFLLFLLTQTDSQPYSNYPAIINVTPNPANTSDTIHITTNGNFNGNLIRIYNGNNVLLERPGIKIKDNQFIHLTATTSGSYR